MYVLLVVRRRAVQAAVAILIRSSFAAAEDFCRLVGSPLRDATRIIIDCVVSRIVFSGEKMILPEL